MRQVALLTEPRLGPQQLKAPTRERFFRGGPLYRIHVFQTRPQVIDRRGQLRIGSTLRQVDEQKPTIPDDLSGQMQICRMHRPSSNAYVQQSHVLSALSPWNHPAVSSAVPACVVSASEERGCKHVPDEYISARQRAARRVWLPPQRAHWGSLGWGEDRTFTISDPTRCVHMACGGKAPGALRSPFGKGRVLKNCLRGAAECSMQSSMLHGGLPC